MKNLTLQNIATALDGEWFNLNEELLHTEIEGAVIDSRKVEKNYLFFAVKGERVDGHDFAEDVFAKGAIAMVAEKQCDIPYPYLLVTSTLEALKKLAAYYRDGLDTTIIGITGSVGKTSTKEFLASVLEQKFSVLKTEGNFNNEIGVPLTLLRIRDHHQVAVVEMGISDFGEMHRLSQMAKPNICVLTNIGFCHLENLGNRDGVLKAKTEMFDFAAEDADIILNMDDDKLATRKEVNGKKTIFYGTNGDIHADEIMTNGIWGTTCTICYPGESIQVSIPIPGIHMVSNAMAAVAAGMLLGLSPEEIKQGLENIASVGGRLHIIKTDDYTIIDDCYNANPVSVKSSLDVLSNADTRKVAILGDMFELGDTEKELHKSVGYYLKEKQIQTVILIGRLSEFTYEGIKESGADTELYYYPTLEDALDYLDIILKKGDTVLVKASHGMHFEKIVHTLKNGGV